MSAERPHSVPAEPESPNLGAPTPKTPPLAGPPPAGRSPRPGQALQKPPAAGETAFTPEQRLLILDAWRRSGLRHCFGIIPYQTEFSLADLVM